MKALSVNAYRLYDKDLPEYPYQLDVYANYGICWEKGNPRESTEERRLRAQSDFEDILSSPPFSLNKIFFKYRSRQEGISQYDKHSEEHVVTEVQEHQARFLVNLSDYLDVGLFLDHRPARQWIYKQLNEGQTFLNLFCYTGSASVFAALKGALTTNVDLSNTYLDWARENFKLNGLDDRKHHFLRESVIDFIAEGENGASSFDFIFLDPPTFSNSKKMARDFEVERDQDFLIFQTMKLLKDNGKVIFSTNKRSFRLSDNVKSSFKVHDVTRRSIPIDFTDQKIHQCFEITKLN